MKTLFDFEPACVAARGYAARIPGAPKIILGTLPETTAVLEAADLQ